MLNLSSLKYLYVHLLKQIFPHPICKLKTMKRTLLLFQYNIIEGIDCVTFINFFFHFLRNDIIDES